MHTPEEIFEAACTIRSQLPQLLGDKAEELDRKLAELLNKDRATLGLDTQVAVLLAQTDDATREWMRSFLEKKVKERSLQPSTSDSGNPVKMTKFKCPRGDYIWERHSVGEEPIPCPTHPDLALERVTS
jgi:hypothetical protein